MPPLSHNIFKIISIKYYITFIIFFHLVALVCNAQNHNHSITTSAESIGDSTLTVKFNLKKNTVSSFYYFTKNGGFKQLLFDNIFSDTIISKTVETKTPFELYYSYDNTIPILLIPGDSVNIYIKEKSIDVVSTKNSVLENNFFIRLHDAKKPIFDYQIIFFVKSSMKDRNAYLQGLYDSSMLVLQSKKDSLRPEIFDTYNNMIA